MTARTSTSWILLALLLLPTSGSAQCESWLQGPLDDGTLENGANGNLYAALSWDPDGAGPLQARLVVGGDFTSIGGVEARNIAYYDPGLDQWSPFGNGIFTQVNALTVFNGQVVAGCSGDSDTGTFDATVRRWNGSSWDNLSATSTGSVLALTVHNGVLIIGGTFTTTFVDETSNPAAYLAGYNPLTNYWFAIENAGFGTQSNAAVRALASYNGFLYVGGNRRSDLSITGNAVHISYGNVASAWTTITDGTDPGSIYDFVPYNGELVISGSFSELNGVACNEVAGWNGASFHAFHTGVTNPSPQAAIVRAAEVYNGLVIGGSFETASGVTVNGVARWAVGGSSWGTVGQGTNGVVYDLVNYRNKLVAVGTFTEATYAAGHVAVWDGVNWSSLSGGSAQIVNAFIPFNGRMVAAGSFQQPTFSLGAANYIAGWNGSTFSPFGVGMNAPIHALESFKYPGFNGSNELIAGGTFSTAGGVSALRIARWNERLAAFPPPAWEAMGPGFNSNVNAIERASGFTYAGGNFTFSGATPVSRIARWNESTDLWEALGTGMNNAVFALKEYNGQLYAGGSFTTAGGVSTGGLARWNGSSWSSTGLYFSGTVYALEVFGGELYIGGNFVNVTQNPATTVIKNIAKYNGTSYWDVDGEMSAPVYSLFAAPGRLYAGGDFSIAGHVGSAPVAASRVAYWDGSQWHEPLGGADNTVRAFGRLATETHVGGLFTTVGGGSLLTPRWARLNETGLPWFAQSPLSQVVSLYADVSFSASLHGGYTGLSYQWLHDDVPLVDGPGPDGSIISGATSEVLTISNVVYSDKGGYRLQVTNSCGTILSNNAILDFDVTDSPVVSPRVSSFDGIGANPSSGPTVLSFSLARTSAVQFTVHDVRGRRVRRVEIGTLSPGHHQAHWDARDQSGGTVAAGVYFVRLELNGQTLAAKRLTIVR